MDRWTAPFPFRHQTGDYIACGFVRCCKLDWWLGQSCNNKHAWCGAKWSHREREVGDKLVKKRDGPTWLSTMVRNATGSVKEGARRERMDEWNGGRGNGRHVWCRPRLNQRYEERTNGPSLIFYLFSFLRFLKLYMVGTCSQQEKHERSCLGQIVQDTRNMPGMAQDTFYPLLSAAFPMAYESNAALWTMNIWRQGFSHAMLLDQLSNAKQQNSYIHSWLYMCTHQPFLGPFDRTFDNPSKTIKLFCWCFASIPCPAYRTIPHSSNVWGQRKQRCTVSPWMGLSKVNKTKHWMVD